MPLETRTSAALVRASAFLCLLASVHVARADGLASRHPPRVVRKKPASVPADYVLTRNGFFHPSCVIVVQSDEVVGADLSIRGPDGAVRDRLAPCPYPRYDFEGRPIAGGGPLHRAHPGGSSSSGSGSGGGGSATYDGWLLSYSYPGSISSGSNLSTQWVVPEPPTNIADQDIAFFNDIETNTAIVQPVLDFSELPGQWAMEAESLVGNNDVQSTLVAVNPGDTLLGTVTSANCNASGVCSWTITLTDTTTGKSTTQTTAAVTDIPNEVDAAVLETYGVDSCDKLPANGEVPFLDNSLTSAGGATEPETYAFYDLSQNDANAEVPTTCGWNGTASGNDYTLVFGVDPALPDGGTSSSGSSSGSDSGGGASSGSGSSSGAGSGSSSGSASSSSGSSSGTGSGGGTSSGGFQSPGAGTSSGQHGADAGDGDFGGSVDSGCSTTGNHQGPPVGAGIALGCMLAVGLRRRRSK